MRIAFEVSYIGTFFFGSQQQPGKRTVMGEIIKCLEDLSLFSSESDAKITLSGRTDRGVHAKRQIIAFNTDYPERAVSAINKKLPPDIRFTGWSEVPLGFNPRYDVKGRTYRYYFPLNIPGITYDINSMKDTAALFEGIHDFSSFSRPEGKNPEREIIYSKIFSEDDFLVYEICGYSFLWNMVRCIAYCLDSVGKKIMSQDEVSKALDAPFEKRFPAAPSEGLILWNVGCDIEFNTLKIHEKSFLYTNEKIREYSQLKKISEIW